MTSTYDRRRGTRFARCLLAGALAGAGCFGTDATDAPDAAIDPALGGGGSDAGVATPPCAPAPTAPSFVSDVLPPLQRMCAMCHDSDLVPLRIPREFAGGPTREELDAVYAELVAPSALAPGMARVVAGDPERSVLMAFLEGRLDAATYSCMEFGETGFAACLHLGFPGVGQVTVEERERVREWILAGARSDACTVPPPSISPLLHTAVRVHGGHSSLSETELVTVLGEVNEIAAQSGVCFEIELVPFDQRQTSGTEIWFLPPSGAPDRSSLDADEGEIVYDSPPAGEPTDPSFTRTAVHVASVLGARARPSQRQVRDARAQASASPGTAMTASTCGPVQVVTRATCGMQECSGHDTIFMDVVLAPCCTDAITCGVEPARLGRIFPSRTGLLMGLMPSCSELAHLLAPAADATSCEQCTESCPTIEARDVPILGDFDVPGCCRIDGSCGAWTGGLPRAVLDTGTCVDETLLADLLGAASPNPPIRIEPQACTPSGVQPDPRCASAAQMVFPTLTGCCTDNKCGIIMGSTCIVPPGSDPVACDAAM